MTLKSVASIGAVVALLASSTAFADTAATPSAKQVSQIMQLQRMHKTYGVNRSHAGPSTGLLLVSAGVIGVGIAAAAGAFGSSH